jgi:hypothetical protein
VVRMPWEVRAIFQGQGGTFRRFQVYACEAPVHLPWLEGQDRVSREYSADTFPSATTNSSVLMVITTVEYSTTRSTGWPSISTICPWQRWSPSMELSHPISSTAISFRPGTLIGWIFFFSSVYSCVETSWWHSVPVRLTGSWPTGPRRAFSYEKVPQTNRRVPRVIEQRKPGARWVKSCWRIYTSARWGSVRTASAVGQCWLMS